MTKSCEQSKSAWATDGAVFVSTDIVSDEVRVPWDGRNDGNLSSIRDLVKFQYCKVIVD